MKILYDILIKNWAQILLIIGSIIFFIQKSYELRLKKQEIKFSKLQENKILEIKTFYKSYQALFLSLKEYAYQTEFGEHSNEIFSKIRRDISQKIIDFDYTCMTVKLFIDTKDIDTVNEISETFEQVRIGVAMWHNKKGSSEKENNDLTNIINEIIPNKLPNLINRIEYSLRRNFDLEK